ncbi:MAG: uroporphyrinogen decarboxylase family protein [Clostridia bacterium]
MMTPRENLLNLYRKKGYAKAPCHFDLCPSLVETYHRETGSDLPYSEFFDFPEIFVRDLLVKSENHAGYYPSLAQGTQIDNWGVAREPGSEDCAHMTYMRHPMEAFSRSDEFMEYPYPDYLHARESHIREDVRAIQKKGYAAKANMGCTLWEIGWYLRGMEQLMSDMVLEPDLARLHLDRITEISCHRAMVFTKAGVDIILTGDDVGMQHSLMMSEDMYCEWIKPRFTKIISSARKINPDVIIEYHSCGFVKPLIPHFIQAGIDVLNPVQPECMDFGELFGLYGDRISFKGTIGTQSTMPFGTPDDVAAAVIRNLDIAGEKGGLFCAPTHMLEPEVPWENIMAYARTVGSYKK